MDDTHDQGAELAAGLTIPDSARPYRQAARSRGFAAGDPRAIAAAKQGGAIRGEQKRRASIAIWVERFPGVTPEAAREIYTVGFRSGWQSGSKARKKQEAK